MLSTLTAPSSPAPTYRTYPTRPLTFAAVAHLGLHRAGRLLVVARRAHRAHGRVQERLQGARGGRARRCEPPPPPPAAPATDPCALALQSRGRREPGRAQGGLSAGGAGHRARHRSRGAHVFRCADRRTASARAPPTQPNPTQPALTRHPLPYPASVDVSYNVRRLPPVEPRRTPSRTHPLTRRPFARGSSSRTRHASASNGRALWCGSEVRSGAVCACGSSCSSLG